METILFLWMLVPVEIVSILSKHLSLSIWLFINLMAGHALLKVVANFGFVINIHPKNWIFEMLVILLELIFLILLITLESGVAIIQSYVFLKLGLGFFV